MKGNNVRLIRVLSRDKTELIEAIEHFKLDLVSNDLDLRQKTLEYCRNIFNGSMNLKEAVRILKYYRNEISHVKESSSTSKAQKEATIECLKETCIAEIKDFVTNNKYVRGKDRTYRPLPKRLN